MAHNQQKKLINYVIAGSLSNIILNILLIPSFGISGAIQHTAGFNSAGFVIAVNKNPNATMMKMADVAIVADASQLCTALIQELKRCIR